MILLGVIVNTLAIIIGASLGQVLTRISPGMKETVMKAIALAVMVLGFDMAFQSVSFLIVLFSLAIGGILGEWLQVEERLEQVGSWIEQKTEKRMKGNVAKAFVTTTLIYCVGAMAVVGSLDSGLRDDHQVLFTKSVLDGFTAVIFSSTLGIGVIFSAIPVFLYQGSIVLSAAWINDLFSSQMIEQMIANLTATGGILIVAIGVNLLNITKIKVGNLLPALLVVLGLTVLVEHIFPLLQNWLSF